jgi:hypothetical protein
VLQVYSLTGTPQNLAQFNRVTFVDDSADMAQEAAANGKYGADGTIDLRAAGNPCATWIDTGNRPAGPNCFSLQRAEQRFGDGDGRYTLSEQRRASRAFYDLNNGLHNFIGAPRRVRLGVEINF